MRPEPTRADVTRLLDASLSVPYDEAVRLFPMFTAYQIDRLYVGLRDGRFCLHVLDRLAQLRPPWYAHVDARRGRSPPADGESPSWHDAVRAIEDARSRD